MALGTQETRCLWWRGRDAGATVGRAGEGRTAALLRGARVDFLMDPKTRKMFVNEINTMPGFTAISMYPKLWAATGVGYTELIDRLIQLGMERHADKKRNQYRR